jgi:hypothetical protein
MGGTYLGDKIALKILARIGDEYCLEYGLE